MADINGHDYTALPDEFLDKVEVALVALTRGKETPVKLEAHKVLETLKQYKGKRDEKSTAREM